MYKAAVRALVHRCIDNLNRGDATLLLRLASADAELAFPGDNAWAAMYRPVVQGRHRHVTHRGVAECRRVRRTVHGREDTHRDRRCPRERTALEPSYCDPRARLRCGSRRWRPLQQPSRRVRRNAMGSARQMGGLRGHRTVVRLGPQARSDRGAPRTQSCSCLSSVTVGQFRVPERDEPLSNAGRVGCGRASRNRLGLRSPLRRCWRSSGSVRLLLRGVPAESAGPPDRPQQSRTARSRRKARSSSLLASAFSRSRASHACSANATCGVVAVAGSGNAQPITASAPRSRRRCRLADRDRTLDVHRGVGVGEGPIRNTANRTWSPAWRARNPSAVSAAVGRAISTSLSIRHRRCLPVPFCGCSRRAAASIVVNNGRGQASMATHTRRCPRQRLDPETCERTQRPLRRQPSPRAATLRVRPAHAVGAARLRIDGPGT